MKILFATDGSPSADLALDVLLGLRLGVHDEVTVLAVPIHSYVGFGWNGMGAFFAEITEHELAEARRVAQQGCDRIRAAGVAAVARNDEGLTPSTIIDVARAIGADLIVVGSRGLGRVAGALLGSTARAVARHSPIPVLVVQERRTPPRRVLIGADGSSDSEAAIAALAKLPLRDKIQVTLLHVLPERPALDIPSGALGDELKATMERQERERALAVLARARSLLPPAAAPTMRMDRGRPAERILEAAKAEGADLVVLGARGLTLRGDRFFQGSTADRILESGHCDVLVARTGARVEAPPLEREGTEVAAG